MLRHKHTMTSGTVTKTTLMSQPWENVYNLINTRSIIGDPLDPDDLGRRKFVHRRHPRISARGNFAEALPYLVVKMPTMRPTKRSVDGTLQQMEWTVTVELTASDSDKTSHGGTRGRNHVDSVTDNMLSLNQKTHQDTMRGYGMQFPKCVMVDSDIADQHGENVFVVEFELTYKTMVSMT